MSAIFSDAIVDTIITTLKEASEQLKNHNEDYHYCTNIEFISYIENLARNLSIGNLGDIKPFSGHVGGFGEHEM